MAEKDKKFYWLKLKTEFMEGDIVDFLMSQKNGANYVVLYQMLCVKTINTKGSLSTQIGELIVPFDVEKIQRDLKWFDIDTVRVALELYKKLGLVYQQENGILAISDFKEIVGSETYWAKIKRKERDVGNELENVQKPLISNISSSNNLKSINVFDDVISKYNTICFNLPSVYKLTDKRKKAISAFLKQMTLEEFENACEKANNTPFLIGKNDRGWKADFDFIIKPDNTARIIEGKYHSEEPKNDTERFYEELQRFREGAI